jgi:hypothetical protein
VRRDPLAAPFALVALAAIVAACGGGGRDVVPTTRDVQVAAGDATRSAYAYVARRPLGFVALARQTGLGEDLAARAADHLADALDACATDVAAKGRLVEGAIRIDATVTPSGTIAVSHVTIAPGDGVAANALLCVVAPLKLTTFPAVTSEGANTAPRSFAIDVSWGTQQQGSAPPPPAPTPAP